jgi:hypothetical protein
MNAGYRVEIQQFKYQMFEDFFRLLIPVNKKGLATIRVMR